MGVWCLCVCVCDLVPRRKGHHLFMRFAALYEALWGGGGLACVYVCGGVPCGKAHHLFMRFATLGEAWTV